MGRFKWMVVFLGLIALGSIGGLLYTSHNYTAVVGMNWAHVKQGEELKKALDRAAKDWGELNYKWEVCQGAVEQLQAQLQLSIPVGQAFWCEGMPIEMVASEQQPLVIATASFVKKLPSDLSPGVCIDLVSAFGSEVRGEIYVVASRNFSGGASDRLVVYFQKVPGEQDRYRVIGFYDVIERQWHSVEP